MQPYAPEVETAIVLEEAHALLVQRADKIGDPLTGAGEALRRSYLEKVPINRELEQAWAAAHATP